VTTLSLVAYVDAACTPELLQSTLDALTNQTCREWQLCVAPDASASRDVRALLDNASSDDPRVRVVRGDSTGGPSTATNDALSAATGDFVAVIDPGDRLVSGALAALQRTASDHPEMDYCYSDETGLLPTGRLTRPFYKPDWSPERMRAQFFTGRLSAMKRTLVAEAGGFRPDFGGYYERELSLRVSEGAKAIVHIPEVLYLRLTERPDGSSAGELDTNDSGRRAIEQHCDRVGIDAVVEPLDSAGNYRVHRRLRSQPLVSIVVPTRGSAAVVQREHRVHLLHAVSSILERSSYPRFEIVVVPDRETPNAVLENLEELCGSRLRLEWWDGPFNFSAKINAGVAASTGTVALLLNDDVEVLTPDWIETLVGFVDEPDCGLAGCKLVTAVETLQHGGHLYAAGEMLHIYADYPLDEKGMGDMLLVDRECSGVTAACAAVRRDVFEQVGGLCEALPINFNDVDFALKIRRLGLRVIWTPHAVLYHFESLTRGRKNDVSSSESGFVRSRWRRELDVDPYSNPNLDQRTGDWVVARPAESWLL
jgi:GT2 family glycosyltransferase